MGKDSANRWLEEIEDVYYLVRASGLEGDTALAHPYAASHFFSSSSSLPPSPGLGEQKQRLSQLPGSVLEDVARHSGFAHPPSELSCCCIFPRLTAGC